jgi:hypothetical protein
MPEVLGVYRGTGYADVIARPFPIQMVIRSDGTFFGSLIGGPGSYPVRSGRWVQKAVPGSTRCRRLVLMDELSGSTDVCFVAMHHGSVCMNLLFETGEHECYMRRLPGRRD